MPPIFKISTKQIQIFVQKKETSRTTNVPGNTDEVHLPTDPKISISELLEIVNSISQDILPEDVLKHFGYDSRPEGKLGETAIYSLRDEKYLEAAEIGDEQTAGKLVEEAAKEWGAYSVDGKTPLKLYHGTTSFGFTEFDVK